MIIINDEGYTKEDYTFIAEVIGAGLGYNEFYDCYWECKFCENKRSCIVLKDLYLRIKMLGE